MPVYCYKCVDCDHEFESRHSMSFNSQLCVVCKSENVFKRPSLLNKRVFANSQIKPGSVVDEYIEDTKREMREEKKRLSSEEL